jgi:hypothetical protein
MTDIQQSCWEGLKTGVACTAAMHGFDVGSCTLAQLAKAANCLTIY